MQPYDVKLNSDVTTQLHVVPCYFESEYLWSYLARLAYFNGYDGVEHLLNSISDYDDEPCWKKYQGWGYDANRPIVDRLFADNNQIDIIRESTMISALQLFETNWYQANNIKSYTCEYDKNASNKTYIRFPADVEHLNLCPECIKEDSANGMLHYKKIHQIPGITTCPKHRCELLAYTGPLGFELEENSFEKLTSNDLSDIYAEFCLDLITHHRTGSLKDTFYAITKRLSDMYPDLCLDEQYDAITSDAIFNNHKDSALLLRRILFSYNSLNALPTMQAITLLVILFRTYDCFSKYLPKEEELYDKFMKSIKGKFSLQGEFRNDFVRVKCKRCGTTFPTTPKSMIAMEGCPNCNKLQSTHSILVRMLKSADGGIWLNKTPLKSISTKMIFENTKNGEIRICTASDIIFNDYIDTESDQKLKSRYSIKNLPENRQAEYSRLISELSNGEFTVKEEDEPHRFIATNGHIWVKDCSFSRLCRRLLIHMDKGNANESIKDYNAMIAEALHGNKSKLLFPEDYCKLPEYQGNISKAFSRAVSKGKLERYSNGIYSFPGVNHSLEEVVYNRFFYRNGKYVGIPVCDSLISYFEKGTLICTNTEFALLDRGEHNKRERNTMKINDFVCKASYIQAEINDDNWLTTALCFTRKHRKYIRALSPNKKAILNALCIEKGIKIDE